ncbi:MAG TPA: hypothetical protein VMV72_01640 [Verrucomicrobiae bacterium]|nr:hypothetical protein [Verrucomicrobiae bacterium]
MTRLAITSTILGAVSIAGRVPGLVAPEKFGEALRKFPRSVLWGRILMGVCAVWAGIVMFNAATDDWAWARPVVVIGVPIAYWLVIQSADQFLAVRGVAALLLLIAKIAVDAADRSELPLRLVVTVLAYLWVCIAIWMASAPHQVRDVIGFVTTNTVRCRLACFLGICVGALLVVLGTCVY